MKLGRSSLLFIGVFVPFVLFVSNPLLG